MVSAYFVFGACIDQASVGVVEKWGRFLRLASPGLNFFNPFAGEFLAGVLSTRVCSLDVRIETKTKDNVFVQLLCSIQYRIVKESADDAFYELQNPQEQIQAYVFDVVRALVPRMNLDELFEQKGEVAKAVLEELEKVMGAYGYNIEQILIIDVIPDPSVRKAMNEINAAQRLQLASVYKGEAEKILLVKKAEAEAEAKYLAGVGVAKQRQAITEHRQLLALCVWNECQGGDGSDYGHAVLRHPQGSWQLVTEYHRIHPPRSWSREGCHRASSERDDGGRQHQLDRSVEGSDSFLFLSADGLWPCGHC